jgi:hypothetical protein
VEARHRDAACAGLTAPRLTAAPAGTPHLPALTFVARLGFRFPATLLQALANESGNTESDGEGNGSDQEIEQAGRHGM